jgi:DNA end-binding protein Ku
MRSIWKGALSFGLVNIPVKLYTASRDKELQFTLLHKKDHSEIRYARMCKAEEKEVPWEEIVKGYEFQKGDFVVLDDEDFKKIDIQKTRTIEILNFVEQAEIDSVYYVKPYFLEPDKNAAHAYSLLCEALRKSKKVGIAKYVIRNREHLAVVKPKGNLLILNELRYQSELVKPVELEVPATKKTNGKELDIALKLIDQLTVPFKPEDYTDTYVNEVMEMIERKAKGRPIHPKAPPSKVTPLRDIMSLLQASLEKKPRKKARTTKAA